MHYQSDVVAAIGGTKKAIQQFVEKTNAANLPDKYNILKDFQTCHINTLSLFILRSDYYDWYEEVSETWNKIKALAEAAQLSWIFHRMGNAYADVEDESNSHQEYFNLEMLELFIIEHISTQHHLLDELLSPI